MRMNRKQKRTITIMDFSSVYEKENFFQDEKVEWIDCTDIKGTNCFCDTEAEEIIKNRIGSISANGLHFIDSGNYHYVTEFWLDKIHEKFCLVVLDHHSDMQKPLFTDIVSCGSWVMHAIDNNRYLQKVIMIGLSKEQEERIAPVYRKKVICINNEDVRADNLYRKVNAISLDCPVYISLDKDVLSKKVINTSWDQGDMELSELRNIIHILVSKYSIIGLDICGECTCESGILSDSKDDRLNALLLQFIKNEVKNPA